MGESACWADQVCQACGRLELPVNDDGTCRDCALSPTAPTTSVAPAVIDRAASTGSICPAPTD